MNPYKDAIIGAYKKWEGVRIAAPKFKKFLKKKSSKTLFIFQKLSSKAK
jgi:hypothetical protein